MVGASPVPLTTGAGATGVLPGLPGTEIGVALVAGAVADAVVGAGAGVLPV